MVYINSIMKMQDHTLIPLLVDFYKIEKTNKILDATYGKGRFWKKGRLEGLITMDVSDYGGPDIIGDNQNMPFSNDSFDTIVYDPPHLPDAPKNSVFQIYHQHTWDGNFVPFLKEAHRVLVKDGIVIAKIADRIALPNWNHVRFINEASNLGFLEFDFLIKERGISIPPGGGKMKKQHRARKKHCFFIVLKKQ